MEPHVKERIVGAVVLIAVGVWLIPWILDGPDEVESESESLPEFTMPAVEPIATVETENPARDESVRATEAAPMPETASAAESEDPSDRAEIENASRAEAAAGEGGGEGGGEAGEGAGAAPSVAEAAPAEPPRDRGGWSVQLGAFSDKANADQLAKRVSTYGYSAYVSEFQSSGKPMYRVRVGGFDSENSAEAAASSISAHSIPARVISPE